MTRFVRTVLRIGGEVNAAGGHVQILLGGVRDEEPAIVRTVAKHPVGCIPGRKPMIR